MAWIELHQTLPGHRKTMKLRRMLKIKTPQAVGHLCMLWLWGLDNVQDGDMSGIDDYMIAEAAGWEKDAKVFVEALVESGFLDANHQVHDWMEYAGKLIDRRQANAERMRRARANKKKEQPKRTSATRATDVHDTCDARAGATVPNPTVPYPTVPIHQQQEHAHEESAQTTDPAFASIVRMYEANICSLYPIEGEKLADWYDALGEPALRYSIEESAGANKRSWSHVEAILRALEAEGCKTQAQIDERKRKWAQKAQRPLKAASGSTGNAFLDALNSGRYDDE